MQGFPELPDDFVWTVVVAGIVSALISYFFKTREMRKSAEIDYQYEQKKKLSELIGGRHGRLVAAASRFSLRMNNLYRNDSHGWINVDGNYATSSYYFRSTIYRFMELLCVLRDVERQSILLDTRIAKPTDFNFLKYVTAMNWVISDSELLNENESDVVYQRDHIYADNIRRFCDLSLEEGEFPDIETFEKHFSNDSELEVVLKFFDGVTRGEPRKRWDRLVCLHLLILSFLNSFGHPSDKVGTDEIDRILRQLKHSESKRAFAERLKNYKLDDDPSIRGLSWALRI